MKTVFKSAPGFFSAETSKVDKTIPKGKMRINTVTFESYLLDMKDESVDNISFTILAGLTETSARPTLQKELIKRLYQSLHENREHFMS